MGWVSRRGKGTIFFGLGMPSPLGLIRERKAKGVDTARKEPVLEPVLWGRLRMRTFRRKPPIYYAEQREDGNWVVRNQKGEQQIFTNKEFREQFEPIEVKQAPKVNQKVDGKYPPLDHRVDPITGEVTFKVKDGYGSF